MKKPLKRDSMVWYRSFRDAIVSLDPNDQLVVYDAVFKLAFDGIDSELTGVPNAIFTLIRPQILANNKKYLNGIKGGEFGKLGGRPPSDKPQRNPKITPNDNENDNENVDMDVYRITGLQIDNSIIHETLKTEYLDYLSMRKEIKKPFKSAISIDKNYKHLRDISNSDVDTAKQILSQSIANQWQGLFPIKK